MQKIKSQSNQKCEGKQNFFIEVFATICNQLGYQINLRVVVEESQQNIDILDLVFYRPKFLFIIGQFHGELYFVEEQFLVIPSS